MIKKPTYHSPSTVNSFLENRAAWFRNKICGDKFQGSKDTARGTAVEAGINYWLNGDTESTIEGIKHGMETWAKETEFFQEDKDFIENELEYKQSIAPLVNIGCDSVYNKYVIPFNSAPKQQYKIEGNIPGCKWPSFGYIDWFFEKKKVVDNKVSKRSPSSLSQSYKMQGSVYHKATGLPVDFHFEIANKTPVIKILSMTKDDIDYGWKLFCRACRAIEHIFDFIDSVDYDLLENLFLPNPDAFYNEKDVKKALTDFGF